MSLSKENTLRQISEDRALASAMLFPHRHRQESPEFHIEMDDLWRSADQFVSIEAFREGAKSTKAEEFLCLEALFGNAHYILIFGETYTKACQRLESIKYELATNQRIYQLFNKQTGKGLAWSENKIVLPNGCCIEAHGWEEEIRGYKHLQYRPDRVYLDDIENKSMVKDAATVDANWTRIFTELIPAMDTELGKLRITGTPLADYCLITKARNSENFTSAQFPICDRDIDDAEAKSAWPARYPMEWIRAKRDQMAAEGLLNQFMQEYMLVPTGAAGKPFTEENLVFEEVGPTVYSPKVSIIDPARTTDVKKSDQTGDVVVSRIGTKIYVWKSDAQFLQPDGVISLAFARSVEYDDCDVVIEQNSLNEWLNQPMRARMLDTGVSITLRPVNAPQDRNKDQFIMGLQPYFIAGDIVFVGGRQRHKKLINQIINFPSGKKDVLNALAYVTRVFSGTPIYGDFSQRNIVDNYVAPRNAALLLGANATGTETTAVLCALDGQYLTVLADWQSPLMPTDCIPDIARLIRGIYPGRKVVGWIPGDVYDQQGRNQLVSAMKSSGIECNRGETASLSRGQMSPMIRTELRGRRLFCVDSNARYTMKALASGYNWPTKAGGERSSEPERNASRTLIESLETLTTALDKKHNARMPEHNAVNANGTPYYSALPGRR